MSTLKIPKAENLGRVLTKDELKAIVGGAEAIVFCTCTFTKSVNIDGEDYTSTKEGDPDLSAQFGSAQDCQNACTAKCSSIPLCKSAKANFRWGSVTADPKYGSGSGS